MWGWSKHNYHGATGRKRYDGWANWWSHPVEWQEQAFWGTAEEEQVEDPTGWANWWSHPTEWQEQALWCTVEEERVEDPIKEQKQPEEAVTPENEEVTPRGPWWNSRVWRVEGEAVLMEDKVAIVQGQQKVVTLQRWSTQATVPIHRYMIACEVGLQRLFLFPKDYPALALVVERWDEDVISIPDLFMDIPYVEELAEIEVTVVLCQGGEAAQFQAMEIAIGARMLPKVAKMQCVLLGRIEKKHQSRTRFS